MRMLETRKLTVQYNPSELDSMKRSDFTFVLGFPPVSQRVIIVVQGLWWTELRI